MKKVELVQVKALSVLNQGDAGDVLAARRCAQTLLQSIEAPKSLVVQARLLLTAVCLHLNSRVGPDPTLTDIVALLGALNAGDGLAWALAASPMQMVQYVSEELVDGAFDSSNPFDLIIQAILAEKQ